MVSGRDPHASLPDPATRSHDRPVVLGHIQGVFGIRGWLKVFSLTDPIDNILRYSPWTLVSHPGRGGAPGTHEGGDWVVIEGRRHGKGLVAHLRGCDDRDRAQTLVGAEIAVPRSRLPAPGADEFYWTDLEGLAVETLDGVPLGAVSHLLATGANDVLVVRGERERLIPFLWEHTIRDLDFEQARIRVDWDPDF